MKEKSKAILMSILKDMDDFAQMKEIDYAPIYLLGGSGSGSMYNQFCKNLKHFINLINCGGMGNNSRAKNAEVLAWLTDIELYKEYKSKQNNEYKSISNLIYDISRYAEEYPSLKKLVWELWAYGFDIEQANEPVNRNYEINEVVKLADLMLSTHYFH